MHTYLKWSPNINQVSYRGEALGGMFLTRESLWTTYLILFPCPDRLQMADYVCLSFAF